METRKVEVPLTIEVPADATDKDIEKLTEEVNAPDHFIFPEKVYQALKWIALLALPTLAWGYQALGAPDVWNFPYLTQIPFTLNVIGTIIAVLIGASAISNLIKR